MAFAFHIFARDTAGAVAPLFGLFITSLLICCGLAVDYGASSSAKTKLQSAADAAALAVVARAARSNGSEQDLQEARDEGYRLYTHLVGQEADELRATPTIALRYAQGRYDATVTYSVERHNYFAGVMSVGTTRIGGTASASQQAQYLDLHLVLDVSASMGLGASEDDQRRLMQQTGCQFGCHVAEGGPSNEQNAIDLGIPMRIDVLRSATEQLIGDMGTHESPEVMRIALHTFHDQAQEVLPPTDDLAQARDAVRGLRLGLGRPRTANQQEAGSTPDSGDTQPAAMAAHLAAVLERQGSGGRNDPRKFAVIVTDGTQSTWSPGLTTRAWDPGVCRAIHDLGIEVAVIYLEYSYYGKETDGTWPWAIAPIEAQIEPNLRGCANSGLYIRANDPAEIHAAFSRIFREIASRTSVRLTN